MRGAAEDGWLGEPSADFSRHNRPKPQHVIASKCEADEAMSAKLVSLESWLRLTYGGDAPSIKTARRWARESRICPAPQKHGRTYFVPPDARYIGDPTKPMQENKLLKAIYGIKTA
jgi:hypothetical protein